MAAGRRARGRALPAPAAGEPEAVPSPAPVRAAVWCRVFAPVPPALACSPRLALAPSAALRWAWSGVPVRASVWCPVFAPASPAVACSGRRRAPSPAAVAGLRPRLPAAPRPAGVPPATSRPLAAMFANEANKIKIPLGTSRPAAAMFANGCFSSLIFRLECLNICQISPTFAPIFESFLGISKIA